MKFKRGEKVSVISGRHREGVFDHYFNDDHGNKMARIFYGKTKQLQTFHPSLIERMRHDPLQTELEMLRETNKCLNAENQELRARLNE